MSACRCFPEASEHEAKPTEVERCMSLTHKLAHFSSEENRQCVLAAVEAWMDLSGAGMTLISVNKKMSGVDDYAAFWDGEGPQILQILVQTRKRLVSSQTRCSRAADAFTAGQIAEQFQHLLELEVPPAFLTELSNEKVNDIMAWKFTNLCEQLKTSAANLREDTVKYMVDKQAPTDRFEDMRASGEDSWSKGIAEDSDFQKVYEIATRRLFPYAPGKLLKAFSEAAMEERRGHCSRLQASVVSDFTVTVSLYSIYSFQLLLSTLNQLQRLSRNLT